MIPIPIHHYEICEHEVTFKEYKYFCEAENLTGNICVGEDNHPVTHVSWEDAKAYAAWLSRIDPAYHYRLPTSEEWEYAAIGNKHTPYPWGDDPNHACRYANTADGTAKEQGTVDSSMPVHSCYDIFPAVAPVKKFEPNDFGLYDMTGNVWEWVEDCDPRYWNQEEKKCDRFRLIRGGSWSRGPDGTRIDKAKESKSQNTRSEQIGFRLVRERVR